MQLPQRVMCGQRVIMKTALKQIYDRTVSSREGGDASRDWVELWKKPLLPENHGEHACAQTFSRREFEFDSCMLSIRIFHFVCPYKYLIMGT